MEQRLEILFALLVAVGVLTVGIRWWVARHDKRLGALDSSILWSALGEPVDGRPTLVVFSTPSCVTCKASQEPAVQQLAAEFGDRLRVLNVDSSDRPTIAKAFNVLTAPSTAVLAADGHLLGVNHGFASAELLGKQLRSAGDSPASGPLPERQSPPAPPARASVVRR
jgi:thiol-disulfide isomerase/thioredoxin